VDFSLWQGNDSLYEYLPSTCPVEQTPFNSKALEGCDYDESLVRLKRIMRQKYKLRGELLGENLIQCPGYSDDGCIKENWYFSRMASAKKFSRGVFFHGYG
jgi:hypothetical protein